MKKQAFKLLILTLAVVSFSACQKESDLLTNSEDSLESASLKSKNMGKGFVHGIVIEIDGEDYYFKGPADGPNRERDVPGHFWSKAGPNKVVGKHYNTGPFGSAKFWASGADDGEFLYTVKGIIDTWTPDLAEEYAAKGYVHRHEFVRVSDGKPHPSKVIWLKHIAVRHFLFDGPFAPNPMHEHSVSPGIDWEFPNNYMMPYPEPEE